MGLDKIFCGKNGAMVIAPGSLSFVDLYTEDRESLRFVHRAMEGF